MIRRREFLGVLGGAAAAWPHKAGAQQMMPVIGLLGTGAAAEWEHLVEAFRRGLSETGYVEGKSVAIQYRWADGQSVRLPALASDLVARRVAVVAVAGGTAAVLAAKTATKSIPIVFAVGGDPVSSGLVASMNRPGGNVTGATFLSTSLEGKRLELLHELIPTAAVIALLVDTNSPLAELHERDGQAAARATGTRLVVVKVAHESELDAAFATMVQHAAGALLVSSSPLFTSIRGSLTALAARHAIPASYAVREYTDTGGLMSYGTSVADAHRQAGLYVGRILKGEKPSDLPVLQPTRFELVINLKTAKSLGLDVPLSLQQRADEVIE
jgi:putative ABC transport system substrate-binding protein